MDEKTLAICAATLCLLGISLHQTLDSGGAARSAQPPSVALASALPALTASFYGQKLSAGSTTQSLAPAN